MKTYLHYPNTRYWYDPKIKSWVVEEINQNSRLPYEPCEYYANKKSLLRNYPRFKFREEIRDTLPESENDIVGICPATGESVKRLSLVNFED